ncbi:hypothetical protein EUX98_g6633, partial [Antrodiella citrinella]
ERQDDEVRVVEYINHPTLYFEDGNTILSCSSTLFCVHRSILSKHSTVLKNLLDSLDKKSLRGCRHFIMKEGADDIEALLNVIYEGLRVDLPNITVESSPLLSSTLRMCTKYKIEHHDAKMLASRIQQARNAPYIPQNGVNVPNPQYDANAALQEDLIIHPGSVISLLRECGYDSPVVLAPLFYALSRGTWQFGGCAVGHHIAPLSHADVERLIIGVERLRTYHADFVTQLPSFPALVAAHKAQCEAGIRKYWATLGPTMLRATSGSRQPIEDWFSVITQARANPNILSSYSVCAECAKLALAEMDRRREALWTNMPAYFELEG